MKKEEVEMRLVKLETELRFWSKAHLQLQDQFIRYKEKVYAAKKQ